MVCDAAVSYDGALTFGTSTGQGGEQAGVDIRDGIAQTLADLLADGATQAEESNPATRWRLAPSDDGLL